MKISKAAAITAAISLLAAVPAQAKSIEFTIGSNTLYISNPAISQVQLETAPFTENDRTLVPIRVIAENFGAQVDWDEPSETVTVKKDNTEINLILGNDTAFVNGKAVTLDTAAKEINGRTMVPVRFVSEALGYNVDYTDGLDLVYITDEQPLTKIADVAFNIDDYNAFLQINGMTSNALISDTQIDQVNSYLEQVAIFSTEYAKQNQLIDTDSNAELVSYLQANKDNIYQSILLTPVYKTFRLHTETGNYVDQYSYTPMTDEELLAKYQSDYVSAKHILIMTINPDTGEPLSAEEKVAAKRKIDSIAKQLKSGADFDKLMNENSEDTGLASYPDGYVFTHGEMVKEFEDTAFALKEGNVSDVVETSYGYHILKRQPLPEITDETKQKIDNATYSAELTGVYENLKENYPTQNIKTAAEIAALINNQGK